MKKIKKVNDTIFMVKKNYVYRKLDKMIKLIQNIHPIVYVLIATIFEVSGDATMLNLRIRGVSTTEIVFKRRKIYYS